MNPTRLAFSALAAVTVTVSAFLPGAIAGREAPSWWGPSSLHANRTADHVAAELAQPVTVGRFHTGTEFYDAEWVYGTSMMAAMAFGQLAMAEPAKRVHYAKEMERHLERLLGEDARAFDRMAWKSDPLGTLPTEEGHAAYLGYTNLALSLHRLVDPGSRFARQNDAITEAIVRKSLASQNRLIETYPDAVYPVDNAACVGSVGLYDRATGANHEAWLADLEARVRATHIDGNGLLFQAETKRGAVRDGARGSGTILGSYFFSFSHEKLSADLWKASREHLFVARLGFGAMREHPNGGVHSDIDSGPIVLGLGVSPTGFALGAARAHGDEQAFKKLFATAWLFGAPVDTEKGEAFVTGGPLGDSIMLAMLTARPAESWAQPKRSAHASVAKEGAR